MNREIINMLVIVTVIIVCMILCLNIAKKVIVNTEKYNQTVLANYE